MLAIGGAIALPVIIGASCPGPSSPPFFWVVPPDTGQDIGSLPACQPGFVCISVANRSPVPATLGLYRHNGYDPFDQFPDTPRLACCIQSNPQVACPCPCPGKDTGNCRLDRIEIFLEANLDTVAGLTTIPLQPGQSLLKRVRCEDVKTLGASLARENGDPVRLPLDQVGPIYRDEAGGVRCGQTIEFSARELTDTGGGTGGGEDVSVLVLGVQTQ